MDNDASAPPSRLASLPLALVQSIFTLVTTKRKTLERLAEVSFEWREYVESITGVKTLRKVTMDMPLLREAALSRFALLELRRQFTLGRAYLQQLPIGDDMSGDPRIPLAVWTTILAHAPHMEKITIAKHPCDENPTLVVSVVTAAARLCPQLQSLHPPRSCGRSNAEAVFAVVVESLPAWKRFGGLRELIMTEPFGDLVNKTAWATQLISAIVANCPRLESVGNCPLLDNVGTFGDDEVVTADRWFIDLDTWERFCASCSQLARFELAVVPFATPLFEVFGRYAKPKLKKLAMDCRDYWGLISVDQHKGIVTPELEDQTPQAALFACPNLEELVVSDGYRRHSVFGDAFVEAVAQHCRWLERFALGSTSIERQLYPPIENFTDRSMHSLATLPRLVHVKIQAVKITGDSLFQLVVANPTSKSNLQRKYQIVVGEEGGPVRSRRAFYEVVAQFMKRLAEWPGGEPLPCTSAPVVLRLLKANRNEESDWRWAEAFMVHLKHQSMP